MVFNLYIPVQHSQIVRKPKMLRGELNDSYVKGSEAFENLVFGCKVSLKALEKHNKHFYQTRYLKGLNAEK